MINQSKIIINRMKITAIIYVYTYIVRIRKMSYYLIGTVIIALFLILYVWYVTRYTHSIEDDKELSLEDDDDRILTHWYEMNIKQTFDFNVCDNIIASKYIVRNYNIEINPNIIIVGNNLDDQYYTIIGKRLESNYRDGIDCIFDIRSRTGKNVEFAIIHDETIRRELENRNKSDLTELNLIIESDLDIIAGQYLDEILKYRWEQILQLNHPNVLNDSGSFLYLHIDGDTPEVVNIMGNIKALMTTKGARINLLCSNYEFEALIHRLKQYLTLSY